MKSSRVSRTMAYLLAMLMILLTFAPAAQAADGINAAYYKLVEVQRGVHIGHAKVNIRKRPDVDSDRVGRLPLDDYCIVIGEDGDWWQVEYDGVTGYILKELLTITTTVEEVPVIIEDPLEATLTGLTPPTFLEFRNEYRVNGEIESNIPLIRITVEVYNRRTFTVDRSVSAEFKREDNVLSYDLKRLADDLSFRKLDPGEKTLVISVESSSEEAVLSETPFYVDTDGEPYTEMASMTKECEIDVPRGKVSSLTDGKYGDIGVLFKLDDDVVTVSMPASRTPGSITLHWSNAPSSFTLTQMDEAGEVIDAQTQVNESGMIHFYLLLDARAKKLMISTPDGGNMLEELRVYELNREPEMVQKWQEMPEKLDLLVVSAHQDDEMLFFGGTIPYYVAQGKKVGVVYMADCGRDRYAEALDGLWSCGLTYHPIFLDMRDRRTDDYEEAVELWGMETTENALVDIIRKYQPEVIVTHDVNGEYGHDQHKVTCAAMQSAVTRAGDPAISPDSAAQYGTWTPKKLYIHLYEENSITMTAYDEPVESLCGMTMTQVAAIGYSKHVSQQDYFSMDNHGVRYDNRKYGLAFTTVGQDEEKNDLFENIE